MTTLTIDPIEHDITRDETLAMLMEIDDLGVMASRAHGLVSAAVMAMLSRFELHSVLAMLKTIEATAAEATSGMVEQ